MIQGLTILGLLRNSILDRLLDYSPYDYGDFSQNVTDVLQVFIDNDWINEEKIPFQTNKEKKILRLTEDGKKIGKEL